MVAMSSSGATSEICLSGRGTDSSPSTTASSDSVSGPSLRNWATISARLCTVSDDLVGTASRNWARPSRSSTDSCDRTSSSMKSATVEMDKGRSPDSSCVSVRSISTSCVPVASTSNSVGEVACVVGSAGLADSCVAVSGRSESMVRPATAVSGSGVGAGGPSETGSRRSLGATSRRVVSVLCSERGRTSIGSGLVEPGSFTALRRERGKSRSVEFGPCERRNDFVSASGAAGITGKLIWCLQAGRISA